MNKVPSAFSRPLRHSVPEFLVWTTSLLIGLGVIDRLLAGRGPAGVLEVLFGFLWVGWIFVLGALPVWLAFRWLFARFGGRLGGSLPFRGALIGALLWLTAGLLLLGVQLVARAFSPDSQPTVASVVTGLAAVVLLGGVLGALEGRGIRKHARERPNPMTLTDAD